MSGDRRSGLRGQEATGVVARPGPGSYGPLFDALRGVQWPARRVARGLTAGTHPSRMVGTSPEFTEYRPYRQGEDPRRLDWKLLARTDRAYLRITSDRALLATTVLVDASASMAFPERTLAKWVQACRLAVGLLAVAHAAGDPVGLVVPTPDGVRALPPRTRRGVVAEAARLLGGARPAGGVELAPALAAVRTGTRVAIVSDFLGDADALLGAAAVRVRAGAEVHAVHVVADEELDPSDTALVTDPEQPMLKRLLGAETRAGYDAAFAAWRAELARAWHAAGASYTEVRTSEAADHAVRRLVRRDAGAVTAG